jgi:phage gp45-like
MKIGKIPLSALIDTPSENISRQIEEMSDRIRVAIPGFIESFDAEKQIVSVRLAIREKVSVDGEPYEDLEVPILTQVPIYMPRAGNFILTMPVTVGDECLVVFSDNCYDSWWETGKVGNQLDLRRHDLSDAIAIVGIWSQPNVVGNYSTDSAVLRNLNGDSLIEVKDTEINIKTTSTVNVESPDVQVSTERALVNATESVEVNSPAIEITGGTITLRNTVSGGMNIEGEGGLSEIDSRIFLQHRHYGGGGGDPDTGEVI